MIPLQSGRYLNLHDYMHAKTLNDVNLYNVQKSSDKSACKLISYLSQLYFTNENANTIKYK